MTVTIDTTAASDSLDDQRTVSISPLVSPATVRAQHAPDEVAAATVRTGRADTINILNGDDDRLIVVVGPCSVHDPEAAMDYARRLAAKAEELRDDLHIVMRVYFEKPRTTLGWKGLLNDPHLDGTFDINTGSVSAASCFSTCRAWACLSAASSLIRSCLSTLPTWSATVRSRPDRRQSGSPSAVQRAVHARRYQELHRR